MESSREHEQRGFRAAAQESAKHDRVRSGTGSATNMQKFTIDSQSMNDHISYLIDANIDSNIGLGIWVLRCMLGGFIGHCVNWLT
jgi:hypothetical protein